MFILSTFSFFVSLHKLFCHIFLVLNKHFNKVLYCYFMTERIFVSKLKNVKRNIDFAKSMVYNIYKIIM